MVKKIYSLLIIYSYALSVSAFALPLLDQQRHELKLPSIFGDSMVVQQKDSVAFLVRLYQVKRLS